MRVSAPDVSLFPLICFFGSIGSCSAAVSGLFPGSLRSLPQAASIIHLIESARINRHDWDAYLTTR